MLSRLLSGDTPRSLPLAVLLAMVVAALVLAPILFPGAKALAVAAKILIFVLLVASYDLLLGYTGIVSFAHTMFFGIGAYGVAIASSRMEPSLGALLGGTGAALAVSLVLSVVIGLASLRVRAIFYAMITLAVAAAFQTLVSQLSGLTGGEDGLSFRVPPWLRPGFSVFESSWLHINGRVLTYYIILLVVACSFLALLRVVNSPFGRALQAIRENDFRAQAIGLNTVLYRTGSNVLAALVATLAGSLYALWLRYNGPSTTLSFEIMLDTLLMVVIGGMGTLYGAILGATIFVLAQSYLQNLLAMASEATTGLPLVAALFSPDRWLLWLGILFVLSVYYFPTGIAGRLRARAAVSRTGGHTARMPGAATNEPH